MALTYVRGDELGFWQVPIAGSLAAEDFSTGWTFRLTLAPAGTTTPVVTLDSDIVGEVGQVVVQWPTVGGLNDLAPGRYDAQLECRRLADGRAFTVKELFVIGPKHEP